MQFIDNIVIGLPVKYLFYKYIYNYISYNCDDSVLNIIL